MPRMRVRYGVALDGKFARTFHYGLRSRATAAMTMHPDSDGNNETAEFFVDSAVLGESEEGEAAVDALEEVDVEDEEDEELEVLEVVSSTEAL